MRGRWFGCLAVLALPLLAACDKGAAPGDALEDTGTIRYGVAALEEGRELAVLLMPLRNVSSDKLVIKELRPRVSEGFESVADIVSVELAPRGRGRSPLTMGEYRVYPPVEYYEGACVVQEVQPAEGYVLRPSIDPSDRALLLIRVKGTAAGEATFEGVDVIYTRDGAEYSESIELVIPVTVVEEQDRVPVPFDQRRCLTEGERL